MQDVEVFAITEQPVSIFGDLVTMNQTMSEWTLSHEKNPNFQRCWRLQNCGDCLSKEKDCSWCPLVR
ncbi:hypothetical protein BKA67DRAFT_547631 [Truncatella angustata]|uniref:Uncharacterized protein n=1 Tax=Truncatella angustata TaxID=152316 RepID=A0A9P8UXS5_9PEZI|nr:uncharacterized protein BKA67DRAFT_547631 [Truncatella angustata]KAH6660325.1 hypothetical protein BKA67DRAFT_547631 [Truncatella angustata]